MSDLSEPSDTSTLVNCSKLPPLRIHHLIAWMTATAVLISFCLWLDRVVRNGPPLEDPVIIVSLVIGAVAIAAVLTVVAFGMNWRRQELGFPIAPGDWLLVILATTVSAIVATIAGLFGIVFIFGDDDWQPAYWFLTGLGLLIGWVWLNARGMKSFADTKSWNAFFGMMIVFPGTMLIRLMLGKPFSMLPMVVVIGFLIGAVWLDQRADIRREWPHWVGVGAAALLAAAVIGTFR